MGKKFGWRSGKAHALAYGREPIIALTPASTLTIDFNKGSIFTLTPGENESISASGGIIGQDAYLEVLTSGTTSRTLTFSSGFLATGTLATGTTSGVTFLVHFVYDGTNWCEVSRTSAMS